MKKCQKGFGIVEVVIILALFMVVIAGISYGLVRMERKKETSPVNSSTEVAKFQKSTVVTTRGTVESVDTSAMPMDGEGIFIVKTDDYGLITVAIAAGESTACDKEAVSYPNVDKGAEVLLKGVANDTDRLLVCESGTYIKKP